MTISMFVGCDADIVKVVKYTPKRTYGFPVNKKCPGEQAYDDQTVESPKLATGLQFEIRIPSWQQTISSLFKFRTGNQLLVSLLQIPNHELAVSLTLSIICLLFSFGKKFARNCTLPITFLRLF